MCAGLSFQRVSFFFVPHDRDRKGFTMIQRVALVLAAFALLVIAGCSKAPEAEMQAANNAINAARSAEAEQYVPNAFRMASDTLNAAMAAKNEQDSKFALFRGYGKSKEMFIRAQALAEEASAKAAEEKERVRQEVTNLITEAQAAIDAANAAYAKAPKGKGNKAELELIKTDLVGVAAQFEEAKNDFNAGKYLTAKSKVQAVMQKANSITQEIATAAGMKK